MIEDEIVREVRAAREAFAASHGYDIRAMVAALHQLGIASGREVVRLAPRPAITSPNPSLQPTEAAVTGSQDSTSPETVPAAEL
jgi:hypothetical protein